MTSHIHDFVQSGNGNVLVHCVAGVSRSAALCMAYLIRYAGMDLMHAYEHVKKRRSRVRPNPGFVSQLMDWKVLFTVLQTYRRCNHTYQQTSVV